MPFSVAGLESSFNSLVPPWLILLIGLGLGQSNIFTETLHWCERNAESKLVPAYTLLVILYLSYVALKPYLQPVITNFLVTKRQPPLDEINTFTNDNDDIDTTDQPCDLSGAYKLTSNVNFEAFLEVQGVPWALRRAANSARPVHRIFHRGNNLTIRIEGPIVSQTTYLINGPPVETNVRGRIFADKVTYIYENDNQDNNVCKGILVSKKAITNNYDVTVRRELSEDKQFIYMTSTAHFQDRKEDVESKQVFERIE